MVDDANVLSVQEASTTIIGPTTDNEVPTGNLGPLEVWTGSNVGSPLSRLARVIGAKLTYICSGSAPGVLSLVSRVDGAAEVAERTFPATTAAPETARAWPGAGGIGVSARSFQMGIRRTGGTNVSRVSVRELEVNVRVRRPRA